MLQYIFFRLLFPLFVWLNRWTSPIVATRYSDFIPVSEKCLVLSYTRSFTNGSSHTNRSRTHRSSSPQGSVFETLVYTIYTLILIAFQYICSFKSFKRSFELETWNIKQTLSTILKRNVVPCCLAKCISVLALELCFMFPFWRAITPLKDAWTAYLRSPVSFMIFGLALSTDLKLQRYTAQWHRCSV